MNEKKVSIIIPVYNVETYLIKCLDSVINQTYKNLEILLINDGSTDGCDIICNQYKNIDCRIKYIFQKNAGLSAARNNGIDNSTGELLFFLDSDDYIDYKTIEILCNDIDKNDADIVICGYKKVFDDDSIGSIKDEVIVFSGGDNLNNIYEECKNDVIISCAKIYRKRLFEDVRFPIGRYHEDEFTTYKLLYKSNKIVSNSSVLYMYRQREGSIMHNEKIYIKSQIDALDAIKESIEFFKEKNEKLYARMISRYFFMMKVSMEQFLDKNIKFMLIETKKRYIKEWKKYHKYIKSTYNGKMVYWLMKYNIKVANKIDSFEKRIKKKYHFLKDN